MCESCDALALLDIVHRCLGGQLPFVYVIEMCRAGVALVANHEDDAVPIVLETRARHGSCSFGRVTEQDVLPIDAFAHHEMAVPIVIDESDSRHADLGEH